MTIRKGAFLLLLTVLAYLTYSAATSERFGWDLTVTQWLQRLDEDSLGPLPDLLFWMGMQGVAGAAAGGAAIWLWLTGRRAEAFFLLLVGLPDIFNIYLRDLIGRPRPSPDLVYVMGGPQGSGFPSGTALHYLLFFGFIIYLSRSLLGSAPLRLTLRLVSGLLIIAIGLGLVHLGRHWTSDVLGGYTYGAFYLFVLIWCYERYTTWRRAHPPDHLPLEVIPAMARARPLVWVLKIMY